MRAPEAVGLALGLAAELHEDAGGDHLGGGLADRRGRPAPEQASECAEPGLDQSGAHGLVRPMARYDVSDFVRQHAGQFVLRLRRLNQPAVDVDEASRERECIDLGAVHDFESVRDPLPSRLLDQGLSEIIDVLDDGRIFDEEDVLLDLPGGQAAEFDLVLLAEAEWVLGEGYRGNGDQDQQS